MAHGPTTPAGRKPLSRRADDASSVPVNRRQFLLRVAAAGALVAAGGPAARAIGPGQRTTILRIRYKGNWSVNRGAGVALGEELRLRTSVDMADAPVTVDLTSARMYDSLFAILAGDEAFSFTDEEREALKRWLGLGGFLLVDNTGQTAPSPGFDKSIRRELQKMFPQTPLTRVSPDHVLYRSFYRLDYPAGRAIHKPYVEGLAIGKRYAVLVDANDFTGALARDEVGRYTNQPTPGGENQREMAIRFGVNLMLYASCLHYKDDQVHLDYLLHSRKWKIRPPQ
ncbi:MAG: DUF4159 domain-containing protein [Deltaproteobacteria bacterium]|nr:MAG: DUF4159 domain-containing protein [Deltaproteobacteria bacterium]